MTKAQSLLRGAPQCDDGDKQTHHFNVMHEGLQEKQAENRIGTCNNPERRGEGLPKVGTLSSGN